MSHYQKFGEEKKSIYCDESHVRRCVCITQSCLPQNTGKEKRKIRNLLAKVEYCQVMVMVMVAGRHDGWLFRFWLVMWCLLCCIRDEWEWIWIMDMDMGRCLIDWCMKYNHLGKTMWGSMSPCCMIMIHDISFYLRIGIRKMEMQLNFYVQCTKDTATARPDF